ncbi:MAG: ATP-binding protein [Methanobrevibacter sp.]|jgi:hypothetical protein|nr:ATP-binding protein [Candidatus Methanovirga australis]
MFKENFKNLKKLGVDTQSFEILRRYDYLYIDKTENIWNLINNGRIYFLSRPRRFGKSLLVSTLKELFKGNKELFKGLYIYDKWNWNKTYPVIQLSMSELTSETPDELKEDILVMIENIAEEKDIGLSEKGSYLIKFGQLIRTLSKISGSNVVILIDEYDKPITDNINNIDLAINIRKILQKFYGALKDVDEYIEFVFITGVSKFSKTSIFSGLNNLNDISLSNDYSTICGYTKDEFKRYFKDYLEIYCKNHGEESVESLIEAVDDWYDGYSWDGKNFVYNPYSILNLFTENIFDNYWFESGTPTFLLKLIEEKGNIEEDLLKPQVVNSSAFSSFKLKNLNLTSVLMQTGYLTIKKRKEFDRTYEYTLDIPNNEVKESLFTHILSMYTKRDDDEIIAIKHKMVRQIINLDNVGFNNNLSELLVEIPNLLHQNADDSYYHSIFIAWLSALRFRIDSEVLTNDGRIDSVLETEHFIAICEIKHDENLSHNILIKEALDQIKDKEYYMKYLKRDKRIIFLAIAFHDKKVKTAIEELH